MQGHLDIPAGAQGFTNVGVLQECTEELFPPSGITVTNVNFHMPYAPERPQNPTPGSQEMSGMGRKHGCGLLPEDTVNDCEAALHV